MGRIPGTFLDNPIEFVESPVEELVRVIYTLLKCFLIE